VVGILAADLGPYGRGNVSLHPVAAALALVIISVPIIRVAAGGDEVVRRVMLAGVVLKLLGAMVRFRVSADIYGGQYDAGFYHDSASTVATTLSERFAWPGEFTFRGEGTTRLAYAIGWLYRLTGPRILTGYLVLAWLCFLGMLMFFRAAVNGISGLDQRRYAKFLFFLPSMLYWPSSLGKEAWMILWLGAAAYGASLILTRRITLGPLLVLVGGLLGAGWVRPHLAALTAAALAAAAVWPTSGHASVRRGRFLKIVLMGGLFVAAYIALGSAFADRGVDSPSGVIGQAALQTAQGGSQFESAQISSPAKLVPGTLTVLFRPFPFEAASPVQLLTSLELFALMVVMLRGRHLPRIRSAFTSSPYARFTVLYVGGFILAFSAVSNFGILARQRAQLWPVLLVLICLPAAAARRGDNRPVARPSVTA
jgi:hypothetical protein